MDELLAGLVFMSAGIVMVVTQGGLVGKLSKTYKRTSLIMAGSILMAFSFFSMVFADSFVMMMLLAIPVCFGLSIAQPSANATLAQEMPVDKRGEILGINESFKSGSRIIGPLIATMMITFDLFLPWYFTGLVLVAGFFLAVLLSISFKNTNRTGSYQVTENPSL